MRWVWSDKISYGATDGKILLLNRKGFNKLVNQKNSAGLITFLLVHECAPCPVGALAVFYSANSQR
jgi:hypothetical protein